MTLQSYTTFNEKWVQRVNSNYPIILEEINLGLHEAEEYKVVKDRTHQKTIKGTNQSVSMVDHILEIIKILSPETEIKYNKYYF